MLGRGATGFFAALVWGATLLHAASLSAIGFFALRTILGLMILYWLWAIIRSSKRILLLSPWFILSVFAFAAYSLIEISFVQFHDILAVDQNPEFRTLSYPGSFGEALVLQFVALGLFLTALTFKFASRPVINSVVESRASSHTETWIGGIPVSLAVIGALVCVDILAALSPAFQAHITSGFGKLVADSGEPLTALGFAFLAHSASRRGGRVTILFILTIFFYLVVKSWIGLVQMPVMIVTVALAYFMIVGRHTALTLGLTGLALLVAGLVMVVAIAQLRLASQIGPNANSFEAAKFVLVYKAIIRQGHSAYCLNEIVSKHRPDPDAEKPFYFVSAIVPRMFWADKPILSRGDQYARQYCGSKSLPEAPHYELVTLLAEPVLEGGFTGLAVVQIFLAISLSLVALAMLRAGSLSLVVIIALLPWLIHFQQSFALYFANAVKMFIYMSPAWAALWWATRRQWTVNHDQVTKG